MSEYHEFAKLSKESADKWVSDTVQRLEARIRELEPDAKRYRWLRDNKNTYPLFFIAQRDPQNIVVQFSGELADMNIDEEMKK